MPADFFGQHHILLNLRDEPHRVENWRGDEHRDFMFHHHEIVVTPTGSGRVAVRFRFTCKLYGLGFGAGVTAATASEITILNTQRGNGFVVVDAQASYQTGPFRIGVSVENLFDRRYFIPYQCLNQAVVRQGTPRSAFVALGVGF